MFELDLAVSSKNIPIAVQPNNIFEKIIINKTRILNPVANKPNYIRLKESVL